MIASVIAYFTTALFVLFSLCVGTVVLNTRNLTSEQTRFGIVTVFVCLFAAWGCAYLGGI